MIRTFVSGCLWWGAAALLILCMMPGAARADRRYFAYTYSPFLDPPGEMEIESWLTAKTGKQDPAVGTQWEPRVEFEYAFHGRLGTAAYLNFAKEPGADLELHSSSVEVIYALAERGSIAGDPAVYLETSGSGDELELESKVLLAHRRERWISGANLIGEFEFRHNDDELLPNGKVLKNGFAGEVTAAVAYEFNPHPLAGARVTLPLRASELRPAIGRAPRRGPEHQPALRRGAARPGRVAAGVGDSEHVGSPEPRRLREGSDARDPGVRALATSRSAAFSASAKPRNPRSPSTRSRGE